MISDEAIREFLLESHEGLDALDREFVALETNPASPERIADIFRTVHTIKGSSGFLGFARLGAIAHAGENLLSGLRDGSFPLTPAMISALLMLVDRVRGLLRAIEQGGVEEPGDDSELIDLFGRLKESAPAVTEVTAATAVQAAQPIASSAPPPIDTGPLVKLGIAAPPTGKTEDLPASAPAAPASLSVPLNPVRGAGESSSGAALADTNVRVDVAILDKLVNLVGELVLARNQVLQLGVQFGNSMFESAAQRLNLITSELQEQVMRTRMQPIGSVWSKLPRVVRDLATTCGKQVRVEMIGKDTELDRTLLEAIKDPLVHIVRNAVDHGLEAPEIRQQRGKPRTGTLSLRAFHQAGQVNIEISDDGGGINLERVRQKALERQLVTLEQVEQMNDYELTQLVFLPGFSTAEKVTNLSGRGVGMDVVRTNIERIGGNIELANRPGQGTTLKIRIPLTLAIVPALLIVNGGQRFAIPQTNLLEVVRIEGGKSARRIEDLHGVPVYRLRGKLLPLVNLSRTLKLKESEPGAVDKSPHIIVLQADDTRFGLIVDSVLDTEEIVVKPLGKELKGLNVFAGATIMGDGQVALILDIAGLAQHSNASVKAEDRAVRAAVPVANDLAADARQSLLLFTTDDKGSVMALPLDVISRLEKFAPEQFESTGNTRVAQYRGEVMPVIGTLSRNGSDTPTLDSVPVIVYEDDGHRAGVMVHQILDVVEETIRIDRRNSHTGVFGTAIVQGRVTEIMDIRGLIETQLPWFFREQAA